ncbi:MAG: Rpn family recombination-promoting nuclease/putative transposase, partial [Synergistaceae bacterium]|nr:Rpn family recombination-promoting nuclease/putative transposase [Synergistaceae bacterium]
MDNDFLDVLATGLNLAEEERWENLTLANDFMFEKVFQDPELCLDLVRIILPELNIERITFTELQKSSRETLDTRGVRFDIYLRDDRNRIINVEMQAAKRDNIIKRSRAYHSVIDLDAMDKETMKVYNDMPEAIVIFICCFDLFHTGRHIYTFKKFCVQDKSLMLGDDATTIFLNTRGTEDDISPKLKAFLEFIEGKSSDDEFVKKLENKFFEAKQNRYWRQEYMLTKFDRNSYREEGRVEGRAEGREEGRIEGFAK